MTHDRTPARRSQIAALGVLALIAALGVVAAPPSAQAASAPPSYTERRVTLPDPVAGTGCAWMGRSNLRVIATRNTPATAMMGGVEGRDHSETGVSTTAGSNCAAVWKTVSDAWSVSTSPLDTPCILSHTETAVTTGDYAGTARSTAGRGDFYLNGSRVSAVNTPVDVTGALTQTKTDVPCDGVSTTTTASYESAVLNGFEVACDGPAGPNEPNAATGVQSFLLNCTRTESSDPGYLTTFEYTAAYKAVPCDVTIDSDGDTLGDCLEYDRGTSASSTDTDGDGIGDAADTCNNILPPWFTGSCEQPPPPLDTDGDGTPDTTDPCPLDPTNACTTPTPTVTTTALGSGQLTRMCGDVTDDLYQVTGGDPFVLRGQYLCTYLFSNSLAKEALAATLAQDSLTLTDILTKSVVGEYVPAVGSTGLTPKLKAVAAKVAEELLLRRGYGDVNDFVGFSAATIGSGVVISQVEGNGACMQLNVWRDGNQIRSDYRLVYNQAGLTRKAQADSYAQVFTKKTGRLISTYPATQVPMQCITSGDANLASARTKVFTAVETSALKLG